MRISGISSSALFSPTPANHSRPAAASSVRRDNTQLSARGKKSAYDNQIKILEQQRDALTENKKELHAELRKTDLSDEVKKKALQNKLELLDSQLNNINAQLTQLHLRKQQEAAEKAAEEAEQTAPGARDVRSEEEKESAQLTKDILNLNTARESLTQASDLKITKARLREQAGWQREWAETNKAAANKDGLVETPNAELSSLEEGISGLDAAVAQQINRAGKKPEKEEPETELSAFAAPGDEEPEASVRRGEKAEPVFAEVRE